MRKIIKAKFSKGVFVPLENVDLEDERDIQITIIDPALSKSNESSEVLPENTPESVGEEKPSEDIDLNDQHSPEEEQKDKDTRKFTWSSLHRIKGVIKYLLPIGMVISIIAYFHTDPKLYFEISGERTGNPIRILPGHEMLPVAVKTTGSKPVEVNSIEVKFNSVNGFALTPDSVIGGGPELTHDGDFPLSVSFKGPFQISPDVGLTLGVKYACENSSASIPLKIEATAKVQDWSVRFPFSMVSTHQRKFERVASFVCTGHAQMSEHELFKSYGFPLRGGEQLYSVGDMAKEELKATAPEGPAELRVIEILEDGSFNSENVTVR